MFGFEFERSQSDNHSTSRTENNTNLMENATLQLTIRSNKALVESGDNLIKIDAEDNTGEAPYLDSDSDSGSNFSRLYWDVDSKYEIPSDGEDKESSSDEGQFLERSSHRAHEEGDAYLSDGHAIPEYKNSECQSSQRENESAETEEYSRNVHRDARNIFYRQDTTIKPSTSPLSLPSPVLPISLPLLYQAPPTLPEFPSLTSGLGEIFEYPQPYHIYIDNYITDPPLPIILPARRKAQGEIYLREIWSQLPNTSTISYLQQPAIWEGQIGTLFTPSITPYPQQAAFWVGEIGTIPFPVGQLDQPQLQDPAQVVYQYPIRVGPKLTTNFPPGPATTAALLSTMQGTQRRAVWRYWIGEFGTRKFPPGLAIPEHLHNTMQAAAEERRRPMEPYAL
ncbi:hypothetical protein B0O99DRAFT_593423 [Bisporella sp. PMI_857]|nr:hypothetical protein B0O99DRAFT_593423 [Bisporella sp. PMI_857]